MEDYEDAYSISLECSRLAVADGATESSFARMWAEILVEAYIGHPVIDEEQLPEWLDHLRAQWHRGIDWGSLEWFALAKARQGAFSTLLGLTLEPAAGGLKWKALACGDTCLFLVRDSELVSAFPLGDSRDFNRSPPLLGSNLRGKGTCLGIQFGAGTCRHGDVMYLATDALAHWILSQAESGRLPWRSLSRIATHKGFKFFVNRARKRKDRPMRNDDTTLLRARIPRNTR
jgi:hypothetical protein